MDFKYETLPSSFEEVTFNQEKVKVLKYLPIKDKMDLIDIALNNSIENNIVNPLKLEMYFNLYLVFMYTDVTFTDEQKEDLPSLYDSLSVSGLLQKVLTAIPKDEYQTLFQYLEDSRSNYEYYRNNAAGVINNIINDLPAQAEAVAAIIDNFDPKKYQAVVDFATAANGNRPIE